MTDYVPFGPEWENEMMKSRKEMIIKMCGNFGIELATLAASHRRLVEALQEGLEGSKDIKKWHKEAHAALAEAEVILSEVGE